MATASCATKSGTGTAVGAGIGGAAGYALGGTTGLIIGGALGGALGYSVGREMDEEDRRRAAYALEQNRYMEWRTDDGDMYRMQPRRTSYMDGRECREFTMHADIDGQPEHVNGVACRRSDGSWETIST
ncbi:MAG TPA: glycine zipper domain-containing protein [Kofleriaceae bacterium]